MKMKKITQLAFAALLAVMSISAYAQNDLGVSCGCPPVSSRTTVVNMSTLCYPGTPEIRVNTHLTCDKMYILDQKVYVADSITLTIDPGTVIKGNSVADPTNAVALIIERGGKIIADGTSSCPIVMTATEDPMDGTYSLTNVGKWGGLVLLGMAQNNLDTIVSGGGVYGSGKIAISEGVGFIEGFDKSNSWNHFGAGPNDPKPWFRVVKNNDNSGILRYVSVRHAGAIIVSGNELNGISLGSVGNGTTIEHVEVVAAADDNIECFGGTVNLKYCSTLFGDDDMLDWDLGYSGKVQFYFAIATDSLNSGNVKTTDNGYEADSDDKKSLNVAGQQNAVRSIPVIYNTTLISNGHFKPSADNTGPAAIMAKEATGGEIYNSIFANFRSGLHLMSLRSNATDKGDAYDNWTDHGTPYYQPNGVAQPQILKVKNNTFVNCGGRSAAFAYGNTLHYPVTTGKMASGSGATIKQERFTVPTPADTIQFFVTDKNVAVNSLAGIDWVMAFSADNSTMTNPYHAIPLINLTTDVTPPADGFFSVVSYRGAFDATKKDNWLSGWAQMQMQSISASNPTDINGDGITDINDFIIFSGRFGFPSN